MNHINSLFVESYRGIQNLQLNDFSLINIFTGNNNSGKTSVLELLKTLKSPFSLSTWLSNSRRGTHFRMLPDFEAFSDLFNVNSDEKIISYTVSDSNAVQYNILVSARFSTKILSESQVQKEMGIIRRRKENEEILEIEVQTAMVDFSDGKQTVSYELNEFSRYFSKKNDSDYIIHSPVIYISPTSHADNIIYLDEILNNPQLYADMLSVLKDFDADILSINASTPSSKDEIRLYNRVYYCILSKNKNKALPLNMYGDGMKKAILLMSAVVAAKDGILLLDEFETAIHTSVMSEVFCWIIKTCKKLNVQLFMTTHSLEALKTVLSLSDKLKEEISLYTLYKKEKTVARRLTAKDAIEASDIFNLELR